MAKTLMREVTLKHWLSADGKNDLGSKALLISVLQAPKNPQRGTNIAEIREVTPVLDMIQNTDEAPKPAFASGDRPQVGEKLADGTLVTTGGSFQITDGQWKDLKDRVANFPFQFNVALILKFSDDIESEKSVPSVEMVKKVAEPAAPAGGTAAAPDSPASTDTAG